VLANTAHIARKHASFAKKWRVGKIEDFRSDFLKSRFFKTEAAAVQVNCGECLAWSCACKHRTHRPQARELREEMARGKN